MFRYKMSFYFITIFLSFQWTFNIISGYAKGMKNSLRQIINYLIFRVNNFII